VAIACIYSATLARRPSGSSRMSSDTEVQVTSTHDPGMETADEKVVEGGEEIEVEVVQKDRSNRRMGELRDQVDQLLRTEIRYLTRYLKLVEFEGWPVLQEHVESVTVCMDEEDRGVHLPTANLAITVFKLSAEVEEITGGGEEEEVSLAQHWVLPNKEFQGIWENLVYDTSVKSDLLAYMETAMDMSRSGVDQHIVGCNRVVLLHGPPGSGKTSLCRALAQKLSVRMEETYSSGQLVEINSHSLFSKWFSESGKLVQKMFEEIRRLVENPRSLVCVLIDEVESLTAARKAGAGEPSDAIRVVNALLTQLDSIKTHPNVLVLTTSNITGAIDIAFVDRADIKMFVGPPSQAAVFRILLTCVRELVRKGLVAEGGTLPLLTLRELRLTNFSAGAATQLSLDLWHTAATCHQGGLSGRALRKAPFLALALHCKKGVPLHKYLAALDKAVRRQLEEQRQLAS